MGTYKGRQHLVTNYKRAILQLEMEAKAMATHNPNSKVYRSAKNAIETIGHTLKAIDRKWIDSGYKGPIVPDLSDVA